MGLVSIRLLLSLFAAIVGILLFIYTEILTQQFYREDSQINTKLNKIELNINRIENNILKSTILLYYDYDHINKEIGNIEKLIDDLCSSKLLKNKSYYEVYTSLKSFRKNFNIYKDYIERFLSINGSIKNSLIYIQTLHLKVFGKINISDNNNEKLMMLLAKITTTISRAKNAHDLSFIKDIKKYKIELDNYMGKYSGPAKPILITLDRHLKLFIRYFPLYISYFSKIMNMHLKEKSVEIINKYHKYSKINLYKVNYNIRIMLALYLLSLLIVIYFIFKAEKDLKKLKKLHENLKNSYITDSLTGVKNRQAFSEDIKKIEEPALILVNIDRFQYINDYYGINIGDSVLKKVAEILSNFNINGLEKETYRVGGDDFGILYSRKSISDDIYTICKKLYDYIDKADINVCDIDFYISVAIGASTKDDKLFETADMALEYAKQSTRSHIAVFNKDIDNSEEIAKNINLIKNIKKSISKDIKSTIIAHFQPIMNLHTNKIDHYEALARLYGVDNKMLLPSEFLNVIKMVKLSGILTIEMLKQTLEETKNNDFEFGINITANDILDEVESKKILNILKDSGSRTKQIIFEILESEEITNYERISEFIKDVKKLGAKVAIDDFGSGYSNLEKTLNLDIDFLKIDGSLIKKLDYDKNAELIVETIVSFSKKAGFKTIAEFVYNNDILNKVRELGVDYAQGYYIGRPSPTLQFKDINSLS